MKNQQKKQTRAKENLKTSTGGTNPQPRRNSDKPVKPIRTDDELAKRAGIGKDNMRKIEFIANNGTEEQKVRAVKGGIGIEEIISMTNFYTLYIWKD